MIQYLIIKYKSLKQDIASINWNSSWEEEEKYLVELKDERSRYPDDFEFDSLFQYKAQVYHLNKKKRTVLAFLSTITVFYLLLLCFCNYIKFFLKKEKSKDKNKVAYFYSKSIFSEKIQVNKTLHFIAVKDLFLSCNDLLFIFKSFRKIGFNVNILSPTIFRVAQVAYAKKKYGISEAWVNMEYSCASGILHAYCKKHDILLMNFMHGDKVLSLRDSFSSFDFFYCWDQAYKEIFEKLLTNSQIIVESPFAQNILLNTGVTKKLCYFFHGCETFEEIELIRENLFFLKTNGFTIYLKDHPRNECRSSYFDYEVVDTSKRISDVLVEHDYIMSQYSTVLYESFFQSNCNLIIDDISNRKYLKLKERGWGKLFEENSRVFFMSKMLNI
ncbi:hypothetical protein [Myroides sp. DF42-4-2]|uniref:hypothetical protein n=1 Tax=Myroides sp. DF42-4-2 TaxID=2746726 RepID=UPI002577984F|nr:hypothetical protein [Myroides sp. DF42-4-2]MDM1408185.1 hypothetical protein [Myroides sp. DF42-4-2]